MDILTILLIAIDIMFKIVVLDILYNIVKQKNKGYIKRVNGTYKLKLPKEEDD